MRAAFGLWLAAIAAGVFETFVVVAGGDAGDSPAIGVAVRAAVYVVVVLVALRMRAGRRWARLALALGLGVAGTLSLLIGPVEWLLDGNSVRAQSENGGAIWWLETAARALHVAAVWAAVPLMFTPAANRFFRGAAARVAR